MTSRELKSWLTWENGKLLRYDIVTPGVKVTPETVACASRAGAFLDANLFPDSSKKVGESWQVSARMSPIISMPNPILNRAPMAS